VRALALIAMIGACGGKADECTRIKDKVRPVLVKMAHDLDKPLGDREREEMLAELCAPAQSDEQKKVRECLLDADGQGETAACLGDAFEDYRSASARPEPRDAAPAPPPPSPPPPPPRDAGVTGPTQPAIDVTTLPEWPVPPGTRAVGPATDVVAVDEVADRLLVPLWPAGSLIAPAAGTTMTGRVHARSRGEAFAAVAAQARFSALPIAIAGHAAAVDFEFAAAPQHDLVDVLGEVLKIQFVVAAGELPNLDVRLHGQPADGVLAAIAKLDERALVRSGSITFFIGKDAKLPALPAVAGGKVDLVSHGASAAELVALLRAVADVPLDACGGAPLWLSLHGVPLADAVRAIEVAAGATLEKAGTCPVTATSDPHPDLAGVQLTGFASAGGKSAALLARDRARVIAPNAKRGEVGFEIDGRAVPEPGRIDPLPQDFDTWLARVQRVSSIVRWGPHSTVSVRLAGRSYPLVVIDGRNFELPNPGATVELHDDAIVLPDPRRPDATITIPLSH
jgi:hypothetical protein